MNILLVEDDDTVSSYVAAGLRREGWHVTCAYDGEEGLCGALDTGYDAAILDIMLPKLGGLEILKRVRADGKTLPIIILSARGSVEDKVKGLALGADDYLAKPFSITELIARLQALVRRSGIGADSNLLRVADLEMDTMTHRVTRAGRRIELQPLEYQLLEYFLHNKGRVVTKTTIMERVWDYSFMPHTNVVECRISRLRSKIAEKGEKELLHTVRGFGYVLDER